MQVPDEIKAIVSSVSEQLIDGGAQAIVFTGSYVRGTAGPRSDIDLYAIGDGPEYRLERHNDRLVSVSWRTKEAVEEEFREPRDAGCAVPGWRDAIAIHDPGGIAAELMQAASDWTWDEIGEDKLNCWVAEELTGYTEDILKMVAMIENSDLHAATAQRAWLSIELPFIMSIYLRQLYGSENVVWKMVASAMGPDWVRIQHAAFGLNGESALETCRAVLTLYLATYRHISHHCDDRQHEVIKLGIDGIESLKLNQSGRRQ